MEHDITYIPQYQWNLHNSRCPHNNHIFLQIRHSSNTFRIFFYITTKEWNAQAVAFRGWLSGRAKCPAETMAGIELVCVRNLLINSVPWVRCYQMPARVKGGVQCGSETNNVARSRVGDGGTDEKAGCGDGGGREEDKNGQYHDCCDHIPLTLDISTECIPELETVDDDSDNLRVNWSKMSPANLELVY